MWRPTAELTYPPLILPHFPLSLLEMPFVPSVVKRAAVAAGFPDTQEGYAAYQAELKAAAAPRELGELPRHGPRQTRTSSNRRRRSALASAGGRPRGLSVRHHGRRLRINMNTGVGVNEIHPRHVSPLDEANVGAAYRLHRGSAPIAAAGAAAFEAIDQKRRRKTLKNVMNRRAGLGEKEGLANINAALADLSARASLNAANSMAIAALGERLYELMESNRDF